MKHEMDLTGQVALVTGGSGVIGGAIAERLAEAGAKIAILGRYPEKAEPLMQQIREAGGSAIALQADVVDQDSLQVASNQLFQAFGGLDILVNCAGGTKPEATTSPERSFFDLDPEAFRDVIDLNLTGTFLPSQVFGKLIAEKGKGNIINIASMTSFLPLTRTVAYSASKAAVANFTKWLATYMNENVSKEIRVNAVAPGFLLTTQNEYLLKQPDGSPTERGQKVLAKTPMGRYGDPDEIAEAVLWLCSDAARFVNGVILPVDGGFSAGWGV